MTRGQTDTSSEDAAFRVVTFQIAGETLALDVLCVREVLRARPLTNVPQCPAWVDGVINVRGRIIPVLDLRPRLRLEPSPLTNESRIIITDHGARLLGIAADRVGEVHTLDPASIEPVPEGVDTPRAGFLEGIANDNERTIVLLSLPRLLGLLDAAAQAPHPPLPPIAPAARA